MSDLADGLKEHVQLLRAWGKFELGMTPPAALDYQDTVEKLEQATARIEALEARLALKSGSDREQVMLDVVAKNVEDMNKAVRIGNERQARIDALEAELAGALFDYHVADKTCAENAARIEALEAAGKRLADAMEASGWIEFTGDEFGFRTALAAWRAAEGGV